MQPRILGRLECAAAIAAQTKLRATKGAQLRLKTYVRRNGAEFPKDAPVSIVSGQTYPFSKPVARWSILLALVRAPLPAAFLIMAFFQLETGLLWVNWIYEGTLLVFYLILFFLFSSKSTKIGAALLFVETSLKFLVYDDTEPYIMVPLVSGILGTLYFSYGLVNLDWSSSRGVIFSKCLAAALLIEEATAKALSALQIVNTHFDLYQEGDLSLITRLIYVFSPLVHLIYVFSPLIWALLLLPLLRSEEAEVEETDSTKQQRHSA